MKQTKKSKGWRLAVQSLRILVMVIVGFALVFGVILLFVQHSMIYFPRPYSFPYSRIKDQGAEALSFQTDQGRQYAFYVSPKFAPDEPPEFLWVMFGGNASLALDWMDDIESFPASQAGYLLIDYPGYGFNEGSASPERILENSDLAVEALAARLDVSEEILEGSMGTIGHSLGSATSLQFAANRPVKNVILVSPFTSLRDMARRTVPPPYHWLLLQNYDNEARLKELLSRSSPPRVTIIHGAKDEVIPVDMGRQLAALDKEGIVYHEEPLADHNYIMTIAQGKIIDAVTATGDSSDEEYGTKEEPQEIDAENTARTD